MKKSFQVLFNHPLQFDDGFLWGVRLPYDERSKYIIDYAVDLIGQWCLTQNHGGKIEDISKWTDRNGNIYNLGVSTRLYSYTAALDTNTYFRIDKWWVDDNCDLENGVEITDNNEYFNALSLLMEQDFKTGYNGWLQVYQKMVSRYQTLTQIIPDHTGMLLDYDDQEKN